MYFTYKNISIAEVSNLTGLKISRFENFILSFASSHSIKVTVLRREFQITDLYLAEADQPP